MTTSLERCACEYLPLQFVPSPVYPGLQLQLNNPGSFTQSAFDEQLLASSVLHSSISARSTLIIN